MNQRASGHGACPPGRNPLIPWLVLAVALQLATLRTGALAAADGAGASTATPNRECVILLHGLGRTYRSMARIEQAVRNAGYATANVDYASRSAPIEQLAVDAVPRGVARCRRANAAPIHFVTHSMGGLLVRQYLQEHAAALPEVGRVVMLGPPNQGSELVDLLIHQPAFQRVNGPAGQQLGTGPNGIAARLGPVTYPTGILTGNTRTYIDELLANALPQPNDGKVAVERAKVDGMTDFMVLEANHTFIVTDAHAIEQALYFLRHERFRR